MHLIMFRRSRRASGFVQSVLFSIHVCLARFIGSVLTLTEFSQQTPGPLPARCDPVLRFHLGVCRFRTQLSCGHFSGNLTCKEKWDFSSVPSRKNNTTFTEMASIYYPSITRSNKPYSGADSNGSSCPSAAGYLEGKGNKD